MNHVLAVLALVAAILLWFQIQRWSGRSGESACDDCAQSGCAVRGAHQPGCPEASASPP
jgi:hypothetical protein